MEEQDMVTGRSAWPFKEALPYLLVGLAVFAAGAALGALSPERFQGSLGSLERMARSLEGRGMLEVTLMIFLKNFTAALLSVWLGFILGLFPIFSAFTNGALLGVVVSTAEPGPLAVFLAILPHGIFELPAIFLAWGLGIWRGAMLLRGEPGRKEKGRGAYTVLFKIIAPLLAVAAIIEGYLIAGLR